MKPFQFYRQSKSIRMALFSGAVIGITSLQSCKTAYVPNALNVPLLQEKGELKFLISPSNYQAAYGITDKIGVIVNAQIAKNDEVGNENVLVNGKPSVSFSQKNTVFEAGAGYLGRGGRNLIYELYGGGGVTRTRIVDTNSKNSILGDYDARGLKIFVQPNIGFGTKYFDVAFSPRITALQYGTSTTIYSNQYLVDRKLDQLADHTHVFLEPALTLRGGYKFIKIQAQFGLSLKLSSAVIPYNETLGSLRLVIDIAKWYNK